ncbi:phosphatase PAP2 family protein [Gorillibacterium sp. sgz5001074]|uniref:phosphatase PAP2 family protein n=1 Tax=Gorillibacterium sp. sgz5001074 TaxID=3446695 RepID=UPI003F677E32
MERNGSRFSRDAARVCFIPVLLILLSYTAYRLFRHKVSAEWYAWASDWDAAVYDWTLKWRGPVWTGWAKGMDFLGSAYCEYLLLLIVAPFLIRRKRWKAALVWAAALSGGWWVNHLLKELFQRERPSVVHGVMTVGYSFPSGHAMVSVVFYGMLAYGLLKYGPAGIRRYSALLWLGVAVFLLSMGVSRIYLGVHYASDAAAGLAAGALWLMVWVIPLRLYSRG